MLAQACGTFARSTSAPDLCVRCGWNLHAHTVAPVKAKILRTAKIWADTVKQDVCKSARCRQTIYYAQLVKSGEFHPFNDRPVVLAKERELQTDRESWLVDLAASHFGSCPAREQFRRRR